MNEQAGVFKEKITSNQFNSHKKKPLKYKEFTSHGCFKPVIKYTKLSFD